jgi:hypothetical protein
MSSRKRKQRIDAITADLVETTSAANESELMTSKPDEALFSLDVAGSKGIRQRMTHENKVAAEAPRKLLAKKHQLVKAGQNSAHAEAMAASRVSHKSLEDAYDLWDTPAETGSNKVAVASKPRSAGAAANKQNRSSKILSTAAIGGMSYHPDRVQHEDLIAEAVALELRKKEMDEANRMITTASLPREQPTNDDGDSDGDDSDEETSDEENKGTGGSLVSKRSRRALTQADKNRKKRRKVAEFEKAQNKSKQRLLNSINSVDKINAKLDRSEQQNEELREIKKQRLEKGSAEADGTSNTLKISDVASVPLSDELGGSLRAVIPRGSRIKDQVHALIGAGMANQKAARNKKHNKPHAGPNIKWFPKYKANTQK